MSNYDTNLASEFFVLATLHRLGVDASLTLGNKKAVDIFVARCSGEVVTVDVKGVAGKHDWPAGNIRNVEPKNHFVVLVSFEGRIADPTAMPSVWVVPYVELKTYFREYHGGRLNVSRSDILERGGEYLNAWHLIVGTDG